MPEDLSWEEIVNRVTIASNYLMVRSSADQWEAAFKRTEAVADSIRQLARRTGQTWTGPGAQAFYAHLEKLAKALDDVRTHHVGVVPGLRACATDLETAVRSIPIPTDKVPEVRDRQAMYSRAGVIDEVSPGIFRQAFYQVGYEDLFGMYSSQARQAYQKLRDDYERDLHALPEGRQVDVPGAGRGRQTPGARGGPGTTRPPNNMMPGMMNPNMMNPNMMNPNMMNPNMMGMPTTGMPTTSNLPAPPDTQMPSTEIPTPSLSDPSLDPTRMGGPGLAGIGKLGGGPGGIGGGLGPGGIPLPDIGPSVGPPGGMTGAQTAQTLLTGAAGRGGATTPGGLTPGSASSAVGMAPMGAGLGGHGGPGGETGTQLFEDDKQIFGPGNQDLPGGVLE